jgi:hypothetical protein
MVLSPLLYRLFIQNVNLSKTRLNRSILHMVGRSVIQTIETKDLMPQDATLTFLELG